MELPSHFHRHTTLALCARGAFQETISSDWNEVSEATLIGRPGGVPHANRYGRGEAECLVFEILPHAAEKIQQVTTLLKRPVMLHSEHIPVFTTRIRRELGASDDLTPLSLETLFYELIVNASRLRSYQRTDQPLWLQQAKELLHDCFQSPLQLSEIADTLGIHQALLSKAFRLHFHTTPGEYLRELRVKHAASLLNTGMPLASIAVASGFCDQSHLTRAFTRHFGASPARYRADLSRRSIDGFSGDGRAHRPSPAVLTESPSAPDHVTR